MRKVITALAVFIMPLYSAAQEDTSQQKIQVDVLPLPGPMFFSPAIDLGRQYQIPGKTTPQSLLLAEFDRDLMHKIADAYRLHVLSVEAQIGDDAISAERYINDGLTALQNIIQQHPNVQGNRRFVELYRSVVTEYQLFYGVTEIVGEEEGDIFAIQNELLASSDEAFEFDNIVIPTNLVVQKAQVPLVQNRYVNNQLAYLWIRRPEIMEKWLERSEIYFPMIERIFKEIGVPDELKYLAMIESGLVPYARSKAKAVGMWQFIQATGGMYGLEVNWWVDERRDPEKATRAAGRHLKDLYDIWGDWHLALANYNVSPRRLRSAIASSNGVKDYWVIYPYLPRETRGYVPSFIATTMIASNPEQFGFKKPGIHKPYEYELAEVEGSVDLAVLAQCAGITVDELKHYNPELLRWATPPSVKPYPLKLPVGTKETFVTAYKNLPESERKLTFMHTVNRGETLGRIASRYGLAVADLHKANDGLKSTIYPGQEIVIPLPAGSSLPIMANTPSGGASSPLRSVSVTEPTAAPRPANTTKLLYTVKKGDTIGHIAEWYGTSATKIRAWNNVSNSIRVGQKLTIYVPTARKANFEQVNSMSFAEKQKMVAASKGRGGKSTASTSSQFSYIVKRNDNLHDLARKYNTSIDEIKKINNLNSSRIYVGQKLLLNKE